MVTIYHNPGCRTSRAVLQAIRETGVEPRVVEYLKTGWTREALASLFARMGVSARQALRVRGTPAEELGLTSSAARDEQIIAAMVQHPILVERPIVVTAKGAALCRPADKLAALL